MQEAAGENTDKQNKKQERKGVQSISTFDTNLKIKTAKLTQEFNTGALLIE